MRSAEEIRAEHSRFSTYLFTMSPEKPERRLCLNKRDVYYGVMIALFWVYGEEDISICDIIADSLVKVR